MNFLLYLPPGEVPSPLSSKWLVALVTRSQPGPHRFTELEGSMIAMEWEASRIGGRLGADLETVYFDVHMDGGLRTLAHFVRDFRDALPDGQDLLLADDQGTLVMAVPPGMSAEELLSSFPSEL